MVTFPFWIIRTTDPVNAQDACQRRGQHWAFSTPDKANAFIQTVAPDAQWQIRLVERDNATALITELNAKRFIELCLDPEPGGGGEVIRLSDIAHAMQKAN